MSLTVRPGIERITGFVPEAPRSPSNTPFLLLANNELPFGPAKAVRSAAAALCRTTNRYPDGGATLLRDEIASFHDLEKNRILTGSGSEELLQLLCRVFAKDGDDVLTSEYGFMMYPIIARSVGATPITAKERDFHVDVGAILAAITPATRVIFLTNPANPTGTYIARVDLEHLIRNVPSGVLLVIDEAYAEFVDAGDFTTALGHARDTANVVVTRTFSKLFGLGGLRAGWAYAPPLVVDAVNKIRLPFNVSTVAQAAAIAVLRDPAYIERTRSYIREAAAWTTQRLRKLGLEVTPSMTNFLMVGFPDGAATTAAVVGKLKEEGIFVRPLGAYGLHDRIRITIGTRADMRRLTSRLSVLLKQARA